MSHKKISSEQDARDSTGHGGKPEDTLATVTELPTNGPVSSDRDRCRSGRFCHAYPTCVDDVRSLRNSL
jgi:hypothetical protein